MIIPQILEIETSSYCNRKCVSCIRNSHPDRLKMKDWFVNNKMPLDTIFGIVKEVKNLGFSGIVCLSHYNEPLYDDRLEMIASTIRTDYGVDYVFCHSNGDLLTEDRVKSLDGTLSEIKFSLYDNNQYVREIATYFKNTKATFNNATHIPTHYSPIFDVKTMAEENINHPCFEPRQRMIFNHRGEMLLCCEEVFPTTFYIKYPDSSVEDMLINYQQYIKTLETIGGRNNFDLCRTCPRS